MSKVVIVESPTKAKSIKKYLGSGYEVIASAGHLRDLPKSTFGVDVEHGFEPKYINIRGKTKLINDIKNKAAAASEVYLATDPDREGEAISWHLAILLGLKPGDPHRVTFNEITKKAVTAGIKAVRPIDISLVDAYQARRVLDRIVGYELSPLLWKSVRRGLSAGRVQSVVTKLVVDRENEIRNFVPQEYWNLDLKLATCDSESRQFTARLFSDGNGNKCTPATQEESDTVRRSVENAPAYLKSLTRKTVLKNPPAPFITSTLQQDASRKLGFPSKKTMRIAQDLFEGMNVPELGLTGLITYMRTDSQRLSDESIAAARTFINENYGSNYLPFSPRIFKAKSNAQDAHEAIRPTHPEFTPEKAVTALDKDHYRLYKLIWDRFIACQMNAALFDTVAADVLCGGYVFRANGRTMKFPGFTVLYNIESDQEEENDNTLPPMKQGDALENNGLDCVQKFTTPPSRYNEASLIKAMEEKNIGRPSTYAPTISTILDRGYVEHEGKSLKPTELGEIVTDIMVRYFSDIVDVDFTANMEISLDAVERGQEQWQNVVAGMYGIFSAELASAKSTLETRKVEVPVEVSDQLCELCGKNLIVKSGRFGKFLACPGYPACKFTKPLAKVMPGKCPVCGKNMLELKSKKNKKYFACEDRKACGYMTWDVPLAELCPKCGKTLFRHYTFTEKSIRCNGEGCGYSKPYTPRGRAAMTDDGTPDAEN